jgi:hypothetical protein
MYDKRDQMQIPVDLNNMPYMDSLPEGMDPALYSSDWLDNAENGLTNLGEYPELAASDADLGMFLGDLGRDSPIFLQFFYLFSIFFPNRF